MNWTRHVNIMSKYELYVQALTRHTVKWKSKYRMMAWERLLNDLWPTGGLQFSQSSLGTLFVRLTVCEKEREEEGEMSSLTFYATSQMQNQCVCPLSSLIINWIVHIMIRTWKSKEKNIPRNWTNSSACQNIPVWNSQTVVCVVSETEHK